MTDKASRAEILRNRTEKDERKYQNYYATLQTGEDRELGNGSMEGRNDAGGSQVLRGFLTVSPETQAAIEQSGATPIELRDTTSDPQLF